MGLDAGGTRAGQREDIGFSAWRWMGDLRGSGWTGEGEGREERGREGHLSAAFLQEGEQRGGRSKSSGENVSLRRGCWC